MRARLLVPLAIVVILAGSFWLLQRPEVSPAPMAFQGDSGKPGGIAAPSRTPGSSSTKVGGIAAPHSVDGVAPSLRKRFLDARDLQALYASIDNMLDVPLPERLLYKAVILEACMPYATLTKSTNPDVKQMVERGGLPVMKAARSGNPNDPRVKVATEYLRERSIVNACRGFGETAITRGDVEKAYAQAAAAGNPAAQARLVESRLVNDGGRTDLPEWARKAEVPGNLVKPSPLTSQEQRQLLNILLTADPVAIVEAGHVLTVGGERQVMQVGNSTSNGDPGPYGDWEFMLAACEFGFECGRENLMVSRACGFQGQCAEDLESYLRDYLMPPAEFAMLQANARAIAEAIRARNAGAFQFVDRTGPFFRLTSEPGGVQIH
ncbi:MAG TPA: hypothetical protein VLJ84_09610 [Usitatibacter sp.]|nr:hypothetical protein [Usitatibacter sp.]